MKRNVNRLLSLVLALVMLVGILPMTAEYVSADGNIATPIDTYKASLGAMTDVLYENDMDTQNPIASNASAANLSLDSTVSESGSDTSVKVAYKSNATPQTYFNLDLSSYLVPGNIYSLRVWYKTSDPAIGRLIRIYQGSGSTNGATDGSFGEKGHAQFYTNKADIIGNDADGVEVILSMRATETVNTKRLSIMLGAFGLTTDPAGSVWYDNLVITETWTVENALKYGKKIIALTEDTDLSDFVQSEGAHAGDIIISEDQTLDLNGHKLTANSVTVAAGGKIIDSSNAEGRLNASLVCAADNSYLPLVTESEGYLFVKPNMTDSYVKTSHDKNGFEIALRPGFGKYDGDKSVREDILSKSNAGITLTVTVAWKDVYGQTGEKTVKAFSDEEFTQVYSSTTGKYFYTKFTNPGDSQYYDVTLSLVANGVAVSRTLHFDNLAEANKTYLFVHNFEGSLTWEGSKSNTLYSMRDSSRYITYSYAAPSFEGGTLIMNSGDTANQLNLTLHDVRPNNVKTLVIEMDIRIISAWVKNSNGIYFMVRNTGTGAGNEQYRQQRSINIRSNSTKVDVYDCELPNTPGTAGANDCKHTLVGSAGEITLTEGQFSTLRIVYDFTNYGTAEDMSISVSIDGQNPVTGTLQDFSYGSDYIEFLRNAYQDGMAIDNFKMWYTN